MNGGVMRSYIKWAGGKSRIADKILDLAPKRSMRLIEPFCGSCAFALNAENAADDFVLSDVNPDLIAAHRRAQSEPEALIAELRELFVPQNNVRESYDRLRSEFNSETDMNRRAALFIYLNKHCFNGLCRYNASGAFNVPFGAMRAPSAPEREIREFSVAMSAAEFRNEDFRVMMSEAGDGDLVYCDPPYVPASLTASFAAYAKGGFGISDHRDLAQACADAARRGAVVLLSNHDTETAREIFASADIRKISVSRSVSANRKGRTNADEIIAVWNAKN